jgi:WD40 repeat protein/serine/threonine protein kinase
MPISESPVEAIFSAALAKQSLAERAAFLDETCGGDNELRRRVERLLGAHPKLGSFLEGDMTEVGASVDVLPAHESLGTLIGPYKLLHPIGEGGMGTVFLAEQTHPVQRTVAVKLIKAGMDTRQVIARFEAERQALALMDHPNIARVLDAGATGSGRPYFVMELVKGVPITRYCDERRLTPRQRLELFIPICHAVQHAHQKGIIHRDIKPSNVLIAQYDGEPVPKVIDFGVAKATGPRLTERTFYTEFGALVGTLEYMSPESARGGNQIDIDTRSDIYSLGVLLYELLTGTTPLERKCLQCAALLEALRMIRDVEPPRPSARLSTIDELPSIAANRGLEPKKLNGLVRGELDWIVMKALEKDRNQRYETASALAADVQHYLSDEPVRACPPAAMYRFCKFARRNRRMAAMAGCMLALLVLAVSALAVSYGQVKLALQHKSEALEREKEITYIQRIALAGRELGAGNVGRAEELLDDCPEHLRGWEWHFLKRQRYGNAPPMQHHATVVRVAFSPDGSQIATVCMDGTLAIRDPRTGQVLRTLERPAVLLGAALVRGMAYSPDGRFLAVARNDGEVRVWDSTSGQRLYRLEGHAGPAWQVAFSPDGRILASGGSDRSVRLWDLASGETLQLLPEHPSPVKGVAFRPDGRSVVAACDDGTVKVWDLGTGQKTFSFRGELLAYPWSPWFSSDARRLGWSCLDGVIKIWDTSTGRLEIDQQSNTHQCRAIAFSPDGSRIAVAGFDGTLRLLDAVTGREILTIFAHPSLVADVAFSPDGHQLASASYDQTVRLWDATPLTNDPLAPHCVTLAGHTDKVSEVAFSADGRWLASASWDHTIKLWELCGKGAPRVSTLEGQSTAPTPGAIALRFTLRGHHGIVTGVSFSSDNRTLASASWDDTVRLWDMQSPSGDTLTERRSVSLTRRVTSIAFSPDGQLLAIGQDNGIALYNPASGQEVHPFKQTPAPVPGLAFSPDSRHLISAGASDRAVKVWDVDAEKFRFEIRHNPNPNSCVAVSRDGRRIAAPGPGRAAADHTVRVWDVDWKAKRYTESCTLKGHRGYVWKVAFSPDGRYLASGSWDSTIKVWDLKAPASTEPVTLRGHAGFVLGLAFSPDGRCLASASGYAGHGEIKVWDATLWENKSSWEH